MNTKVLTAFPALMFLIIPNEGEALRQANISKWKQGEVSDVIRMVNLTSDAEKLIAARVRYRGKLKSLNFTGGYRPAKEPVVTAKVNPPIYGACSNYTERFNNAKCKEVFTWSIYNGIVSPLSLRVNTTVHLHVRGKNVTVTLDFNGASTLIWSTRNKKLIKYNGPTTTQECNFSAEAGYSGYVAYQLEEVRGDMPRYDAFNIVDLKNSTKGLEVRNNTLVYNITGQFQHTLMCKG
uniref:Putative conserved secreted protein n=1 Tax=Rhipicephalus microplus TaxID=6941 RepID=A0A6G5A504_RHIMP